MKNKIATKKFLIADDHTVVRKGLRRIIEEAYLGAEIKEAANGFEVENFSQKEIFDVIIMDISMPGKNGLDTLKQLILNKCKSPVLILSMHAEKTYAVRVIKAGASGFLNKESATEELVKAINALMLKKKYITEAVVDQMSEHLSEGSKAPHHLLSDREFQVMQQLAAGKTVTEISQQLNLSTTTINTYRARLLEKLNLRNHAELTRYVMEAGLAEE